MLINEKFHFLTLWILNLKFPHPWAYDILDKDTCLIFKVSEILPKEKFDFEVDMGN